MNGTPQFDPNSFQPLNAAPPPSPPSPPSFDQSSFQPLPPTTPTPPKTGMQRAIEGLTGANDPNEQWRDPITGGMLAGLLKKGGEITGNILDMVSRRPDPSAERTLLGSSQMVNERARQHIQDAATWLKSGGEPDGFWENVGALGEQVLEYVTTDGVLKMAGAPARAAEAAETVSRGVKTAEQLKGAQEVTGVLAKHPKLAGLVAIGMKAAKDAVTSGAALKDAMLMGGQTYLHTEDPAQAATAALLGGGLHVATEGAMAPLARIAPKTLNIGGVEIPALARQVNEAGKPMQGGVTEAEAPKIFAGQQAGAQEVIQNKARQAAAAAIGDINAGRVVAGAPAGAPQLPAPEGSHGFQFTVGQGGEATETPTGTLVQRAEKVPKTESHAGAAGVSPQQAEIGSLARTVPSRSLERPQAFKTASATGEELTAGEQAQSAHDQDTIERLGIKKATGKKLTADENSQLAQARARESTAAATTEPRGETVGGGPALQTTDPHKAEAWLHQLEEELAAPGLSPARQEQIEAQRKTLHDQLGMYYNSPYAQRFDPIDVNAATSQVRTFGDAAQQIRAAQQPIFQRISAQGREAFDPAIAEYNQAKWALRNAPPGAAQDAAQARFDTATKTVGNLIDLNQGAVSAKDYMAAKQAWGKAAKLDELHSTFERMMNDVTDEESQEGYRRVMTGNARAFNRWLDKGNNMMALDGMIGKDGRQNLKDITLLLSNAKEGRQSGEAASAIAREITKHIGRAGMGAAAGAGAAYMMGYSPWYGAMAGATGEDGIRMVLRIVAHEPRIGNLFTYAVRNNVAAKVYAPLIARAIMTPMQSQATPEQDQGGTQ